MAGNPVTHLTIRYSNLLLDLLVLLDISPNMYYKYGKSF